MAENQDKTPAMQSNPADTSSNSRRRKAEMVIPADPPVSVRRKAPLIYIVLHLISFSSGFDFPKMLSLYS